MMKYGKVTLLAGLIVPGAVFAQIGVGDALGASEADVRAALKAQGYVITEVELEDGEIEVEATRDGKAYEIEVSAETGIVLEIELDDEDDSNDS
ncbi:PepSY domain-containing protein [Roseobacter sp. YSTF-M11]|uniref:PepSY domain-containing protein n=1 Tax=Roseobacter insulae TaxID=2859783 RepID=A0A9X1FY82_9RHOB|nr:PepSY domain-containing protein [Roseobacter insulae]MBW4709766.1 PepSY domain-containing protein [Roseobacter insulae]